MIAAQREGVAPAIFQVPNPPIDAPARISRLRSTLNSRSTVSRMAKARLASGPSARQPTAARPSTSSHWGKTTIIGNVLARASICGPMPPIRGSLPSVLAIAWHHADVEQHGPFLVGAIRRGNEDRVLVFARLVAIDARKETRRRFVRTHLSHDLLQSRPQLSTNRPQNRTRSTRFSISARSPGADSV